MRDEMKATKDEMRRIWRGLTYHCNELSTFMAEHGSDKWFETDEGKEMMNHAMKLTLSHISGLMRIDGDSFGFKVDNLANAFEEALKSFKDLAGFVAKATRLAFFTTHIMEMRSMRLLTSKGG